MVEYINSIGRRKTSVARAYMKAGGKGQITINDKKFEKYFVPLYLINHKMKIIKIMN